MEGFIYVSRQAIRSNLLNCYRHCRSSWQLNKLLEQRVQERTTELEEKNAELHRMNRLFVGRELKMVELKEKLAKLEKTKTRPE